MKELKQQKATKEQGQKPTGNKKKATHYKRAPVRLWVRSKFLGFRRSREIQQPDQALLKIEDVNTAQDASKYLGKRVVYIYKAQSKKLGSKFRTIWGRVSRCHGNKGVVIARFSPNLPAKAMGATLRVMLFPTRN